MDYPKFPALMLYFEDIDLLSRALSAEDFRDTVLCLRRLADTGQLPACSEKVRSACALLKSAVEENPKHIYVF